MKKYILVCLIVAFSVSVSGPISHLEAGDKIPVGHVAMHLVGQAYFSLGLAYTMGVFTFIEGIPFDQVVAPNEPESPPEERAFFTFMGSWLDAELQGTFDEFYWFQSHPGRELWVWYDITHNQDWDDRNTFRDGEPIAKFRIGRAQSLAGSIDYQYQRLMVSAELIESYPFDIDGKRYDFNDLLPGGITLSLFGYGMEGWFAGSALAKEKKVEARE